MRRRIAIQSLVSALGFGAIWAVLALAGDDFFLSHARLFFAAAIILPAFAMSWRAGAAWLGLAGLLAFVVGFLNDGKIALIEMPLTWLDLQIAATNPAGFLNAVKVSPALAYSVVGALAAGALAVALWRIMKLDPATARANAPVRALAVLVAGGLAWTTIGQMSGRLETAIQNHDLAEIANMPEGLVQTAQLVGAVPFLALTARYEAHSQTPFRKLAESAQDSASSIAALIGDVQTETNKAVTAMAAVQEDVTAVAAVSEENAAAAEEVSASTEQTSAATQEVAASAEHMAQSAQNLEDIVRRFTL